MKAETSVLREIYRVESSEYDAMRKLQSLESRLQAVRREREELAEEVITLADEIQRLEDRLGRSLRYIYKSFHRGNLVRALLRSRSMESFLRVWRAAKRTANEDRRKLLTYRARTLRIADTRERLAEAERRIAPLLAERQAEAQAYRLEREKRLVLLDRIKADRGLIERTSRELLSDREGAEGTIGGLTTEEPPDFARLEPPDLDFGARKGYLKPPVNGPIVSFFGLVRNERLGTVTRNSGIEILASEGTPVVAAAQGLVRFAGEIQGYGRAVILDHGRRYHTLYGHLQVVSCRVGRLLREGEVLGTVGSTGSLAGPRLHFGIRHKGAAIDPVPWLARETE
ncbi:MAG: peptidoglycan DD-metalloendopeptidase family protein [Deltaproteobacteria bacterium]|nr:peptidoglycan DD-metalloendopeptidase family protein [Deltaproteobacteria bacterium]